MPGFKTCWGEVVPNQEMFSARHHSLFGEAPRYGAILSHHDLYDAVVFDGEAWRELDLGAMQNAIIQEQDNVL